MQAQNNALNRLNYLVGETEALYHDMAYHMGLSVAAFCGCFAGAAD